MKIKNPSDAHEKQSCESCLRMEECSSDNNINEWKNGKCKNFLSDAKPKSKEPFSVASTERLSNVPRSAVRPDAPKSPASKDACSPETSARHGAKVRDICPERQDSAGRPSDALDKIQERWEKIVKDRDFDTYVGCNCERCKPTWDKMFSEIRELLAKEREESRVFWVEMKNKELAFYIGKIKEKDVLLALKDKRIAELEERLKGTCADCEAEGFRIKQDERIAALEKEKKELKADLNKTKDEDGNGFMSLLTEARSQGRNEAIAEIEPIIIEMASLDMKQKESYKKNPDVIATVYFETNWDLLLRKIASMKKEVGKDG